MGYFEEYRTTGSLANTVTLWSAWATPAHRTQMKTKRERIIIVCWASGGQWGSLCWELEREQIEGRTQRGEIPSEILFI